MRHVWKDLLDWLDDRTGIQSAVRRFLSEEIPASSGWRQVFGSVALFLLMAQAFTGVLLAFNYAPTPGDAYTSVRYILTQVTGGRLVRGLHHWGASMIVVVVVLHMIQVFLFGAYKKPREATWIAGVALFLVTLAYSLTGYLLPWDNRAYWGTVITTRIAGQVPLAGPYLMRLLGSEGAVTVVTFARFYGLHVLVLPAATILLVSIHIYLVRRHGVAPVPRDEFANRKPFYPGQVFKDTVAIFIAFSILFSMAIVARVPLEQLADPSDSSYIPRPEWYFLFLFQALKLFAGPLELVGTVVLPSAAILALISVPFIDRGRMISVTKRVTAFAIVSLAIVAWAGLTTAALATTSKPQRPKIDYAGPTEWMQLPPKDLAAVASFRIESCQGCHSDASKAAPTLTSMPSRRPTEWLMEHFKQHWSTRADAYPRQNQLQEDQRKLLAAFFTNLNPTSVSAMKNAPDFAADGAMVYRANYCDSCHMVNGAGATIGPSLNGLSRRHDESWVVQHFADPRKLSPNTIMPSYQLSAKDLTNLTQYLFSLDSNR